MGINKDEDALRVNLAPPALSLDACTVAGARANACWRLIVGIAGLRLWLCWDENLNACVGSAPR
jgi:hypothetical protein